MTIGPRLLITCMAGTMAATLNFRAISARFPRACMMSDIDIRAISARCPRARAKSVVDFRVIAARPCVVRVRLLCDDRVFFSFFACPYHGRVPLARDVRVLVCAWSPILSCDMGVRAQSKSLAVPHLSCCYLFLHIVYPSRLIRYLMKIFNLISFIFGDQILTTLQLLQPLFHLSIFLDQPFQL